MVIAETDMMENKISVVINTYNAEEHLRKVLDHVKSFDEVLICDMESTDSTCSIAEEYGCKIITFPKGEHKICEPARNFAIHSASSKWVLVIDADEIVPATLRDYLYDTINDPKFDNAFAIPRINMFMGEKFKEKTDYQIRFFQKEKATWPSTIHSHPFIDGEIIKLPAKEELCLEHLDNSSISIIINKMNTYTSYDMKRRCYKKLTVRKMLFRPLWFFMRSLFLKGGIRHGRRGIVNAFMTATYQMTLLSKITEWKLNNDLKK